MSSLIRLLNWSSIVNSRALVFACDAGLPLAWGNDAIGRKAKSEVVRSLTQALCVASPTHLIDDEHHPLQQVFRRCKIEIPFREKTETMLARMLSVV